MTPREAKKEPTMTTETPAEVLASAKITAELLRKDSRRVCRSMADELDSFRERMERSLAAGRVVAWSRTEEITDDSGMAIGTDEPRVVWGSEHPDPSEAWFPLYDGPMPAEPAKASGSAPDVHQSEGVRTTAWHIAKVIDYIEKQYPGATKLDAEPIMRNLRRWHKALAATPPASAPEVADVVLPLESATAAGLTCDDLLSDWVSGGIEPAESGTYLRQFPAGEFAEDPEETEALSSWDGIGQWKMGDASDFFSNPSPEQSAPWRGVCPRKLIAALTAALQEPHHDR